jgi:hypothetical protein
MANHRRHCPKVKEIDRDFLTDIRSEIPDSRPVKRKRVASRSRQRATTLQVRIRRNSVLPVDLSTTIL